MTPRCKPPQRLRPNIICLLILVPAALAGCGVELGDRPARWDEREVAGADPRRGRELVASGAYGCPACHQIAEIRHARGVVGPALNTFGDRKYIAGVLPNRPSNLIRFLQDPPAISPRTAMPVLGLSADEARDIGAYLYTLRGVYGEGYYGER